MHVAVFVSVFCVAFVCTLGFLVVRKLQTANQPPPAVVNGAAVKEEPLHQIKPVVPEPVKPANPMQEPVKPTSFVTVLSSRPMEQQTSTTVLQRSGSLYEMWTGDITDIGSYVISAPEPLVENWLDIVKTLRPQGFSLAFSAPSFMAASVVDGYPLPIYAPHPFPPGTDLNSPYFSTRGFSSCWMADRDSFLKLQRALRECPEIEAVRGGFLASVSLLAAAQSISVEPMPFALLEQEEVLMTDTEEAATAFLSAATERWPVIPQLLAEDQTFTFANDPFDLAIEEEFKFGVQEEEEEL